MYVCSDVLVFWCSDVLSLFVHLPPEYNSPAPTPRLNTNVVPDLQLGTTEWQKYYDDAAQAYYYYNNSSGESSYDRPAFFQVSASCCYYNRLYYDLSLMTNTNTDTFLISTRHPAEEKVERNQKNLSFNACLGGKTAKNSFK